jgi:hypothetical protein
MSSASRPGRFTPEEKTPTTHWLVRWVGSRVDLDAVEKRKISSPCRESNPDRPAPSLAAIPAEIFELAQLLWLYSKVTENVALYFHSTRASSFLEVYKCHTLSHCTPIFLRSLENEESSISIWSVTSESTLTIPNIFIYLRRHTWDKNVA